MKGLEELCNVLALPEVKMIRRADDDMRQHEKKEEKKEKSGKKRKAKENHHTTNDDFDEDMPLAKFCRISPNSVHIESEGLREKVMLAIHAARAFEVRKSN